MKKIMALVCGLILLLALSIPAFAAVQELKITKITGSANTAATAPVQYLIDSDPTTVWQSAGATTGPLWTQLQLSQAALIDGLEVYGPYTGNLNIEYWQNGNWHSFLAIRDLPGASSGWNLIDLSYDRIVTNQIRLTLTTTQPQILGGIGAVKVLGRLPGDLFMRLDPLSVADPSQSEYGHPASFLFDHNTYSTWWVYSGSPGVATIADLGAACLIKRLKICGSGPETIQRQNQGTLRVQYLVNGTWVDLPGFLPMNLKAMPNGWQTIDLPTPVTTTKIQVVLTGQSRLGGIREMEIWGCPSSFNGSTYFNTSGNPVTLAASQDANFQYNFSKAPVGNLTLHVTGTGNQAALAWVLNGRPMGGLTPVAKSNGTFLYQAPIPAGWLQDGPNFVRITGTGITITGCRMEVANTNDNLTGNITGFSGNITGFSGNIAGLTGNITGLNNRLVYTPVSSGDTIIDLGGTIHIDELVLRYLNSAPRITLSIERNGQWIPFGSVPSKNPDLVGGELVFSGIGPAQKIKISCQGTGACEVFVDGGRLLDGTPQVKILHPLDGTIYTLSQWGPDSLTGTVDNPDAELRINGQKINFTGTSFKIPLPQTGNPDGNKVIEAVVTDAQGRQGSDKITISVSNPPDFTLNLPDQITYTKDPQITVSGQVIIPQSRVTVNGIAVSLQNQKFSTVVPLKDGMNLITVKVVPNNNTVNTLVRRVVRNSSSPYLKVLSPVDGQIINENITQVNGEVSSLNPVQISVNGQTATVNSGYFTSASIPLVEGNNPLTVIATDSGGTSTKVTLTVKRDTIPPVLANITPVDGSYSNNATVTVNGTVTDASPVSVLVNGKAASVTGGEFSVSLMLNEGQNSLKIVACDAAGNQSNVTRGIFVDTIPPEEFTPAANPSGWTNNTKPKVTFYTIDAGSGIDHYELELDNGNWTTPVTSPYQFTEAIPDGEHTVSVKVVDKAGNFTIGTVKIYIDTTPPVKPQAFRPVPGNGQITLKWVTLDTDVVEYRITRTPAWPEPYHNTDKTEFTDSGLSNGNTYQYTIYAIDRAGNVGETADPCQGTVGLAEVQYQSTKGAVVEYHHLTLYIHPESLPPQIESVQITEIQSNVMQQKAAFPVASPIYQFSTIYNDGQTTVNVNDMGFQKDFVAALQYDPSQIVPGFPEQNLGVYYFDPMWSRWFKVPNSGVDVAHHTIYFSTNHFTSYVVQQTLVPDLTPQELRDTGYSPFKTNSTHSGVTISPQGGSSMVDVTEFSLPGKSGFDFVVKRTYDTATARGDCGAVTLNAALSLSFFSATYNVEQVAMFTEGLLTSGGVSLAQQIQQKLKSYFQNNGDYAYSMGVGWRLNLPYIRGGNSGIIVRLPNGSFHAMNSLSLTSVVDSWGAYRTLTFENHESEDFTLYATQVRADVDVVGLVRGSQYIPGWQLTGAKLVMKDGTTYDFDALGRTTQITDPAGLNTIQLNYNGLVLDHITDTMGREIHFGYANDDIVPRINKIWIKDDTRQVNYTIGYQFGVNGFPCPLLAKAVDVGGREWNYEYGSNLLLSGGLGLKINLLNTILDFVMNYFSCGILGLAGVGLDDITISGNIQSQIVFPLTSVAGPGIGYTKIHYDQKSLNYNVNQWTDYFLGFIPISFQMEFKMMQQIYADRVDIYMHKGDSSPIRTVTYNYDVQYRDHDQFVVAKTVENDGRKETIYYYNTTTKRYIRYLDFSDYAADLANNLINNLKHSTNWLSIFEGLCVEDPYDYDVAPYNTAVVIYDAQTHRLLENSTFQYDLDRMRPTQQTTYHGSNYHQLTYTYDNWGNITFTNDYTYSGDRVSQTKTWTYFYGTNSSPSSDAPWLGSPYTRSTITRARHDLPVGQIVANYVPVYHSNSPTVTYISTYYHYNSLGQPIGSAQWSGSKWQLTDMQYDWITGNLTLKKNPAGHETVYDYDSHGLPKATTEKTIRDAQGNTVDLVTRFGYDYITGWKLWQQDPRGYVTQYQYDVLGRTTQIIAPDDDDQVDWIPAGSNPSYRVNNPVTRITYNDQVFYSNVIDPVGDQTRYNFDNLGRMTQLVKYRRDNGNYVPAATTNINYDNWNNVIAITDPNQHTVNYQYDAMGRNTTITYPDDQGRTPTKQMDFDYLNNILTITDENNKVSKEYQDMQGRTYRKEQHNGSMPVISEHYFDGLGNEVITVDPKGGVTTKTYNQLNLQTRIDLPTEKFWEKGKQVTVTPYQRYEYDDAGFKIAEIHQLPASNTEITNRYDVDELGRTIRATSPYNVFEILKAAVTEIYYDANGNKVKMVDANNTSLPYDQQKTATFEYSATNLLLSETDQAGNKTTYTYDKAGNRISMTDPRGNSGKYTGDFTIVYRYDDLKRLVKGLLPMAPGQTAKPEVNLTYDPRGNLIERVESDGGKTTYTYTPRNKVASETVSGNGVSYTTIHHYDPAGNEIETIDPKGNKTTQEYDDLNQVVKITYPEPSGKVMEIYAYDQNGNKTDYVNGRSVTTHYDYDIYNRLIQVTDGNKGITSYHYDRWGNMTQLVNALGYITNYQYDELNRLLKETDPAGYTKQYGYDPVGNRSWYLDSSGTMSRYTYTPNNLVSKVALQNGDTAKEIQYNYDESGFRKWVNYDNVVNEYNTDSHGYVPDPYNRIHQMTQIFDGQRFTVSYDYDVMGRVTGITYPTGRKVSYQYNSLGQLQKVPGFVDDAPIYDQGGLLKTLKAANGIVTGCDYDSNGRLIKLSYSNQSAVLKKYDLQYDEANNIVQKNGDEFQYDFLNQLLYANLKGNFEINPDEETQRTGKNRSDFKGKKSLEFELKDLDVIELDYAAGSIGVDLLAPMKVTRVELQPKSPIHRVTKTNGIRVYYSQDNAHFTRLNGWKMMVKDKGVLEIVLDAPVIARFLKVKSTFDERDPDFNAVNRAEFTNTPQDLIQVYYLMDTRVEEYTYYPLGNRKTETITQRYPVSRTYIYDDYSIRLKSNGKYNFEYDVNGNMVKKETVTGKKVTWNYKYDLFNRLVKVTKDGQTVASYMYDDSGLRIKKQGLKEVTYYTFDTGGNVIYEQENREYMEYIYVLGKHFARIDGDLDNSTLKKKYFYHTDHLGSTVLVTDEQGKQVYSSEFTPFGKQVSKEGELDHVTKFTGKDLDEDIGLYYYNARWMDSEIGRFISEDTNPGDPNDPRSLNYYTYCYNNPVLYADPDGHLPIIPLLVKAGAGGAADLMAQATMNYFFNSETQGNVGASFGDVNWWQVGRSSAEGLIPWKVPGGRLGKAAATAVGDVLVNALHAGTDYSAEQALQDFAVGFIGDLAGGGLADLVTKYGASSVAKGLAKIGFDYQNVAKFMGGGIKNIDVTYNNVSAKRMMQGWTEGKVAVIGRTQATRVDAFANELSKDLGVNVETFHWDAKLTAAENLEKNQAWIQKLKDEGYTIYDVGLDPKYTDMGNYDKGPYYQMESQEVFGDEI